MHRTALKWIGGVVTAVLVGVITWWLTRSGGPLERVSPSPGHGTPVSESQQPVTVQASAAYEGVIRGLEDSKRLCDFLTAHQGQNVSLKLTLTPKTEGGITDIGHWLEMIPNHRDKDFTMDLKTGEAKGDHLILRLGKDAQFGFNAGYQLTGTFFLGWVNEVGQGYTVASLQASH